MKNITKSRVFLVYFKKKTKNVVKNISQKYFGISGLKDTSGKIKLLYFQYLLATIWTLGMSETARNNFFERKFGNQKIDVLFSVYSGQTEKHYYRKNADILELFKSFRTKIYSENPNYTSSFPECLHVKYKDYDISEYFRTLSCDENNKKSVTYEDILKCITKIDAIDVIKVNRLELSKSGRLVPIEREIYIGENISINNK